MGAKTSTEWMDLLAAQDCDQESFLRGIAQPLKQSPDAGWELLALLDQYYRRNKISAEVFTAVKARLQDLVMGNESGGQLGSPLPPSPEAVEHTVACMPEGPIAIPDRPIVAERLTTLEVSVPTLGGSIPILPARSVPPRRAPLPLISALPKASNVGTHGAPSRTLAVGDVLRGRYVVTAILGQGGMGTVFEVLDQYRLDRSNGEQKVALKVLHTAVIQRPRLFAELRREFQHLQSLSHPNIVRVHEFDRDGDLAFFTMEYLSGVLLIRLLTAHASNPLDRTAAWSIVRDVGAAVVHAHSRGVVHGDLNPGNIFITDNGEVRVLDFGAAHPLRRTPWISDFESSQQINVATPSYASCQLLEGETADPRDDVYAMACVTYILLTGRHPFDDQSALQARTQNLKPGRPSGLTRSQWQALRDGLRPERERRPSDMEVWLKRLDTSAAAGHLPALATLLAARPVRRNGLRWLVTAGFAVLLAAGVAWMAMNGDTVSQMDDSVNAWLKSRLADTVLGQLWRSDRQPALDVPAVAPAEPDTPVHEAVLPGAKEPAAATGVVPGKARIELAADSVEVPPDESVAYVLVRRNRTMRGEASFNWWTESGTARSGRDFTAVKSHVETIPEGKNTVDLAIAVLPDPGRRDPRSFYVVIDEPSDNATLGQRTLTMVTIP